MPAPCCRARAASNVLWHRKAICIVLSIIPAIGSLIVFNQAEPYVLGLPFILFWAILWVVLASGLLLALKLLDPANKGANSPLTFH